MIEELSRSLLQVSIKEGHSVHAQDVVLATATPIHHNLTVHSRQNPYRTFMIALTIPQVSPFSLFVRSHLMPCPDHQEFCFEACLFWAVSQESVKKGLFWSTEQPYHHFRTEDHPEHGTVLIVGGNDQRTGKKPDEYEVWG